MKKHVKNYLKGSGNKEGDFIACERCGGNISVGSLFNITELR